MRLKINTIKRPQRTITPAPLGTPHFNLHYKSTTKEDFTCPYCSTHFSTGDYEYMKTSGKCPECSATIYYYTEYYWDMFFKAVGDDPQWFAKRLESLYDSFEDPERDGVEVPKFAKRVAFNLGMINASTLVHKYMSGGY